MWTGLSIEIRTTEAPRLEVEETSIITRLKGQREETRLLEPGRATPWRVARWGTQRDVAPASNES